MDGKPEPAVENIKANLKIYPYVPGSYGTSIAEALEGGVRLAADPEPPATKFVEASGAAFNTIPPSDFGFFEMINANVQNEPATSYDVELAGELAAIGIVKGKPFAPDERMKQILTDAAAVGNAFGRSLQWRWSDVHPDWAYYPGSAWGSMLWEGGANFETPPPLFKNGMFEPLPPTGARTLDSRTAFYFAYTLDSPGMIMRIPDVGSQYLMGFLDADKQPFDGAKSYKVTLPKDIPAHAFWSLTAYDNQTRSMLQTPQKYPRAGSQDYPSPAARPPRTARRRSGSPRSSPRGWRAATGSRPTRTRAGSPSCGSTAPSRPSSPRNGDRPRSRRWENKRACRGPETEGCSMNGVRRPPAPRCGRSGPRRSRRASSAACRASAHRTSPSRRGSRRGGGSGS